MFGAMPTVFFDFESHVRPDRAVEQLGAARASEQRLEVFSADVWRSFGLVLVAMCGLLAAVRLRASGARPMVINGLIGFMALVTMMEMHSVARRYQPADRGWVRTVEFKSSLHRRCCGQCHFGRPGAA